MAPRASTALIFQPFSDGPWRRRSPVERPSAPGRRWTLSPRVPSLFRLKESGGGRIRPPQPTACGGYGGWYGRTGGATWASAPRPHLDGRRVEKHMIGDAISGLDRVLRDHRPVVVKLFYCHVGDDAADRRVVGHEQGRSRPRRRR